MAFGKTDQMIEKYFKYVLDNHLELEGFEKKFLEGKDELGTVNCTFVNEENLRTMGDVEQELLTTTKRRKKAISK